MKKRLHINNYWKGKDNSKVPYCKSTALGIDTPECSEECCKFDKCTSDRKRNYIINKFTQGENKVTHTDSTNNSGISSLTINDKVYTYKELSEILKKHEVEEDKKYTKCDRCGNKYLENTMHDMVDNYLNEELEHRPGTAWGYSIRPIITGFQINSTCGNGKKVKLCDNCLFELIDWLENRGKVEAYANALNISNEWTSIIERLPNREEYLSFLEDGSSYYKRLNIAYKTDIIEYDIGYFDGYKWFTDRHKIQNVIAWKPFTKYEP